MTGLNGVTVTNQSNHWRVEFSINGEAVLALESSGECAGSEDIPKESIREAAESALSFIGLQPELRLVEAAGEHQFGAYPNDQPWNRSLDPPVFFPAWRNAKTDPPEPGRLVLAYAPDLDGHRVPMICTMNGNYPEAPWFNQHGSLVRPTHWQELPGKPRDL